MPTPIPTPAGDARRQALLGLNSAQWTVVVASGIAGLVLGSQIGVAGFASAVNGAVPGAFVGMMLGYAVAARK
jgi:hypothetical protein